MGLGEPLFLGVKLSTFQTFGILGFLRFGVSIWVKYLAVLHHLVWHRSSKRIAAGRSRKVASLRSKHATKWDCYPRRQELTKIQDRASLSDATTCSVDLDASGREKEVNPARWPRLMQDPANELRRISLLRTRVNRRKRLQRLLGVSRKIFDFCPSDDTVGIGTETRNRSEQRLRGSPSSNGHSLEAGWASSATGYSRVSGE